MCDFKPGDEVVALRDRWNNAKRRFFWQPKTLNRLTKAAVYTVAWVGLVRDNEDEVFVRLVGETGLFSAWAFRKVQRRDLKAWLSTENTIEEPKRAPAKESV